MGIALTILVAGVALMVVGKLLIKLGDAMQRWASRH